jgi:peptide subunit release factor 1 (eRF1)
VLVFADEAHYRLLAEGFGERRTLRHVKSANLVSQPRHLIGERLEEMVEEINRERERELVDRLRSEAHGGTKGALGLEETLQALTEGRVDHLLLDPDRRYELPKGSRLADGGEPELSVMERMVELALSTSAAVTPLEGEAAELLADAGGVGALLRY